MLLLYIVEELKFEGPKCRTEEARAGDDEGFTDNQTTGAAKAESNKTHKKYINQT